MTIRRWNSKSIQ